MAKPLKPTFKFEVVPGEKFGWEISRANFWNQSHPLHRADIWKCHLESLSQWSWLMTIIWMWGTVLVIWSCCSMTSCLLEWMIKTPRWRELWCISFRRKAVTNLPTQSCASWNIFIQKIILPAPATRLKSIPVLKASLAFPPHLIPHLCRESLHQKVCPHHLVQHQQREIIV